MDLGKFTQSLFEGGEGFKHKLFSPDELRITSIQKLAGFVALKEAIVKVISDKKISLNELELKNDLNGKPILASACCQKFGLGKIGLSVAHDGNYVVAIAVLP